jgi:hypothetical protein
MPENPVADCHSSTHREQVLRKIVRLLYSNSPCDHVRRSNRSKWSRTKVIVALDARGRPLVFPRWILLWSSWGGETLAYNVIPLFRNMLPAIGYSVSAIRLDLCFRAFPSARASSCRLEGIGPGRRCMEPLQNTEDSTIEYLFTTTSKVTINPFPAIFLRIT